MASSIYFCPETCKVGLLFLLTSRCKIQKKCNFNLFDVASDTFVLEEQNTLQAGFLVDKSTLDANSRVV